MNNSTSPITVALTSAALAIPAVTPTRRKQRECHGNKRLTTRFSVFLLSFGLGALSSTAIAQRIDNANDGPPPDEYFCQASADGEGWDCSLIQDGNARTGQIAAKPRPRLKTSPVYSRPANSRATESANTQAVAKRPAAAPRKTPRVVAATPQRPARSYPPTPKPVVEAQTVAAIETGPTPPAERSVPAAAQQRISLSEAPEGAIASAASLLISSPRVAVAMPTASYGNTPTRPEPLEIASLVPTSAPEQTPSPDADAFEPLTVSETFGSQAQSSDTESMAASTNVAADNRIQETNTAMSSNGQASSTIKVQRPRPVYDRSAVTVTEAPEQPIAASVTAKVSAVTGTERETPLRVVRPRPVYDDNSLADGQPTQTPKERVMVPTDKVASSHGSRSADAVQAIYPGDEPLAETAAVTRPNIRYADATPPKSVPMQTARPKIVKPRPVYQGSDLERASESKNPTPDAQKADESKRSGVVRPRPVYQESSSTGRG